MGRTGQGSGQGCLLVNWKPVTSTLPSGFSWASGITVSIISGPSWAWPLGPGCHWPGDTVTSCEEIPLLKLASALSRTGRICSTEIFQAWTWCLKTWHLLQIWWKGLEKMLILCLYHGSAEGPGPTSYIFAVVKKKKKKKAQKQKQKNPPKQQQQQQTQTQIWAEPSLLHYCLGKPKLQDCGCPGNHPLVV